MAVRSGGAGRDLEHYSGDLPCGGGSVRIQTGVAACRIRAWWRGMATRRIQAGSTTSTVGLKNETKWRRSDPDGDGLQSRLTDGLINGLTDGLRNSLH